LELAGRLELDLLKLVGRMEVLFMDRALNHITNNDISIFKLLNLTIYVIMNRYDEELSYHFSTTIATAVLISKTFCIKCAPPEGKIVS
jgi:hypothetical protein